MDLIMFLKVMMSSLFSVGNPGGFAGLPNEAISISKLASRAHYASAEAGGKIISRTGGR